jgi:hypothetical protein
MSEAEVTKSQRPIKVPLWLASSFVIIAVVVLGVSAFAPNNGEYTAQSIDGIKRMLLTLFSFSVILERCVEVFVVIVMRPMTLEEIEQAEKDRSDANKMSQGIETTGPESEKATQSKSAISDKNVLRTRRFTSDITVGLAFIIGLLLAFCGLHPLAEFMAPPITKHDFISHVQCHLFYLLDALLTAALLAGGSKGVHTVANSILAFINKLGNSNPRHFRRTR